MYGIMIQGTSSDVGKSFICTALCRALARKGIRVAPFKSQNMSNNSYVTKDGAEIGRAQGVQAEAAEVEPTVMMSPILLKPRNDQTSEVIRFGRVVETLSGFDYRKQFYELGLATITKALESLEEDYEAIVIEGAGSPVEMNLNDRELVNMKVAELADVPVILVADIDRGGIFASIAGTLQLLTEKERSRVIGVIVNKFRGDRALFDSGREWIETNLHIPVLAVLPHVNNHRIESEDSLARESRYSMKKRVDKSLDLVMIDLPYLANDTDIEPFRYEKDVSIRLVGMHDELGYPDSVILPGTQSTIRDLERMKSSGLGEQLIRYIEKGGTVIGISGGYHMLGETLLDGTCSQTDAQVEGLSIFPIQTTFGSEKQTVPAKGLFTHAKLHSLSKVAGFQVQHGKVQPLQAITPLLSIQEREDGVFAEGGRLIGTSMHHLFYHDDFRAWWLNRLRRARGFNERQAENVKVERLRAYDEIADWLERELDIDSLLSKMKTWREQNA
ncbi:cobyric acid synthase [bacterium LRH843]|nr:cobyric acid synthase [bacterium LRH843]